MKEKNKLFTNLLTQASALSDSFFFSLQYFARLNDNALLAPHDRPGDVDCQAFFLQAFFLSSIVYSHSLKTVLFFDYAALL